MSEDLRLTGCRVLTDAGLRDADVTIRDGVLGLGVVSAARSVDLGGHWVLPGIIDLHGDGFERHVAPRRGMVTDPGRGLDAAETEIAAAGVTTAWLAQFWSWEGGMRGPDFARSIAAAMAARRAGQRLDLRLQLRLETHMVDDGPAVRALVAEHGIDYVVFNDHLPHKHLADGRTPPRLTGSALKARRSPEAHHALMRALEARGDEVHPFVEALVGGWAERGIHLGSHDDADGPARDRWGDAGLRISEFPVTREAALRAHARGEPVVMGAPNVVRGGSHDGGVSASALVADGLVTALASDYHYAALADAAMTLVRRDGMALANAWALISSGPAAIMGLTDRGKIEAGLRADLVLFDPDADRITGTFCAGRPVYLWGKAAEAVLAGAE